MRKFTAIIIKYYMCEIMISFRWYLLQSLDDAIGSLSADSSVCDIASTLNKLGAGRASGGLLLVDDDAGATDDVTIVVNGNRPMSTSSTIGC